MRVNVTKTFLPPIEEYHHYLRQMWDSAWITNQGPLLQQFEAQASQYLNVPNFQFVANGTLALQIALRGLDITDGEIITTPFSYVATTSAILWERCRPVYVDIEPSTFTIDPTKIEAAITERTRAIMPVHVFGHPCDVEAIEVIAKKHNLKVIYDGAHAFGATYKGRSLLSYGDISTCSFHATKLFHTIEGGCIIAPDPELNSKHELVKRFGHDFDEHYMLGTNAKASEAHAAMGLVNLKYVDGLIAKRKQVSEQYSQLLGDKFQRPQPGPGYNYSYYPIVLKDEATLKAKMEALKAVDIHPRRYFYPSLNTLPYLEDRQSCPVSEDIASRILCLPLYPELEEATIKQICDVLMA